MEEGKVFLWQPDVGAVYSLFHKAVIDIPINNAPIFSCSLTLSVAKTFFTVCRLCGGMRRRPAGAKRAGVAPSQAPAACRMTCCK